MMARAHYPIELVPVSCVAAAAGIAGRQRRARIVLTGACVAVALLAAVGGVVHHALHPPYQRELAVARYVCDHARPGDTQYVMYARANVNYYAGLPSPYPYEWSLMVRAVPDARARLQRLLASPQRPTWVVQWQDDDIWRLDRGDRTDRLLARGYRLAATVQGHRVYRRLDLTAGVR